MRGSVRRRQERLQTRPCIQWCRSKLNAMHSYGQKQSKSCHLKQQVKRIHVPQWSLRASTNSNGRLTHMRLYRASRARRAGI